MEMQAVIIEGQGEEFQAVQSGEIEGSLQKQCTSATAR